VLVHDAPQGVRAAPRGRRAADEQRGQNEKRGNTRIGPGGWWLPRWVFHPLVIKPFSSSLRTRMLGGVVRAVSNDRPYQIWTLLRFSPSGNSLSRCNSMISLKYHGFPVAFL